MHTLHSLPLIDVSQSPTGCCALIDPAAWDEQVFTFNNKLFAKVRTRSFFHVPLNMNTAMKDAQAKIDAANAAAAEWIILSSEVSPWHTEHYFAVTKDVPGLEMTQLSGTFLTKVFEGRYQDAYKWHRQLVEYVQSKARAPLALYLFYTTCPKCASIYGKNYVVGFAQVD